MLLNNNTDINTGKREGEGKYTDNNMPLNNVTASKSIKFQPVSLVCKYDILSEYCVKSNESLSKVLKLSFQMTSLLNDVKNDIRFFFLLN